MSTRAPSRSSSPTKGGSSSTLTQTTSRRPASPTKPPSSSSSLRTKLSSSPAKRPASLARPSVSQQAPRPAAETTEDETSDDEAPVRKRGFGGYETAKEARSSIESSVDDTGDDDDDDDGAAQNVVVCLRVRPTRTRTPTTPIYALTPLTSSLALTPAHPTFLKRGQTPATNRMDEYDFAFDLLLAEGQRTEELYDRRIRGVVRAAMAGFNGTVFAYGQTASGKTHTMMGSPDEPGVIPLAIAELFSFIQVQNDKRTFTLRVSFLEIYNEAFRDLLASSPGTAKLDVHGDDGTVRGLEERPVSGPEDVLGLLREGETRRRTGATDWNERSSRSHVVFVVTIESISKLDDGVARTSRLNLIDLAGSESATGQSERLKEGSFINRSLLTLGTVIGKLTESRSLTGPAPHIPYRDSKLTRLLQPALSGNSRVAVICTISPDAEQATETLSTLKFARRAKMVVTKAERGLLMTDQMMVKQYAAQVEQLQAEIRARVRAVQDDEMAKERDQAIARVDELQSRSRATEEALADKDLELQRLREQLEHTKSFMLTGAVVAANARRQSGQFVAGLLSPVRPKRIASEMSGLGLGTPRASQMRLASAEVAGSPRVGSIANETALEQQLEAAQQKLRDLALKDVEVDTLKTQLSVLQRSSSLARIEAEQATRASGDRKQALLATQRELDLVRAQLGDVQRLGESREQEMDTLRAADGETAKLLADLRRELAETKVALAQLEATIKERDVKVDEQAAQLERQQRELDEAKAPDGREERIRTLKYELAFAKKELGALVALHNRCPDEAASLRSERDMARMSAAEAEARVKDVEELSQMEVRRHEVDEAQTRSERDTAVTKLEDKIELLDKALAVESNAVARLARELDSKATEIASLRRAVDAADALEQQRKVYAVNQRQGTEALKSRLESLQARSSTPTPGVLSHSTSKMPQPTSVEVVELQVRNGELSSRIEQLQRSQAESRPFSRGGSMAELPSMNGIAKLSDPAQMDRLNAVIEEKERLLVRSQANGEHWRQKYNDLLAQAGSRSAHLSSGPSSPPRAPLHSINRTSPPPSRQPSFSHSPNPTYTYSPNPSRNQPPPLPYSPSMKDKERKTRRETIDRDIVHLRQTRGVERSKSLLESPGSSPTKPTFENLPPPPPMPWSARKATGPLRSSHAAGGQPSTATTPKKSSTDVARLWS